VKKLSVVIPSRLGSNPDRTKTSLGFIERAVQSVRAQSVADRIAIDVLIGVDAGAEIPPHLASTLNVSIVESDGRSQAAALNAAARKAKGDFIAFLEDDDTWHPHFLEFALGCLQHCDFASSTQLEVNEKNDVLRIQDFPTPSGWVMSRSTWEKVGEFNQEYRWCLDNEWLGRLAEQNVRRLHLVEATAPNALAFLDCRPWLRNVLTRGGPNIALIRHTEAFPLITRLVHAASGTGQIASNPEASARHKKEYAQLEKRFGRIPA